MNQVRVCWTHEDVCRCRVGDPLLPGAEPGRRARACRAAGGVPRRVADLPRQEPPGHVPGRPGPIYRRPRRRLRADQARPRDRGARDRAGHRRPRAGVPLHRDPPAGPAAGVEGRVSPTVRHCRRDGRRRAAWRASLAAVSSRTWPTPSPPPPGPRPWPATRLAGQPWRSPPRHRPRGIPWRSRGAGEGDVEKTSKRRTPSGGRDGPTGSSQSRRLGVLPAKEYRNRPCRWNDHRNAAPSERWPHPWGRRPRSTSGEARRAAAARRGVPDDVRRYTDAAYAVSVNSKKLTISVAVTMGLLLLLTRAVRAAPR